MPRTEAARPRLGARPHLAARIAHRPRHRRRRSRLITALVIPFALAGTGTGLAYWAAAGTGEGTAVAGTAQPLTAAGTTSAGLLYPGGTSALSLEVSNPNPYPVTITGVTANGAVTATGGIGSCTTTGVALGTPTGGLPVTIPASSSLVISLAGAATMSNASENGCQGATFTIPVALSGTSG